MTRARDVANLIGSGNYSSTTFTATAGQTAFTISHTQGFIQVFMNGLLLDETVDYTSNGSAVTLTSGAAAGDEIEVVKYNTFSVGDAIAASGGTFTGAVTASNGLTVDDDGATPLTVDRATNNGDIIDLQKDGTTKGSIGTNVYSEFNIESESNLTFTQKSSTDRSINFGTDHFGPFITDNGGLDLGRSNGRWKDLYLSGGAYIGGTAAANKLDIYQEGTYTISERHGQATITNNRVNYTRIGRLVFVGASITVGSNSNGNVLNLTLPFASSINGHYLGGGNTAYTNISNTYKDNLRVNVENAADNVFFTYGNSNTNLTCANASGARIDFFCMYQT